MYPIIIVYNDNDSNAHRRSLLFRSMNTCVMVPHSQTCMNAVSPVRTKKTGVNHCSQCQLRSDHDPFIIIIYHDYLP